MVVRGLARALIGLEVYSSLLGDLRGTITIVGNLARVLIGLGVYSSLLDLRNNSSKGLSTRSNWPRSL